MKSLHKFRHGLDTVLSWVCALLFAAMVVVGTYQIVTRYFFGRPSTVSEELLTYSFTWMALLSSALVFGKRDHMRMGFLADKITGTPRKVLEIISECLVLLLAAVVMLYGGVSIMKLTMTQVTASLGIPMGTVYTVLPLSGALIVVYSVLNIIDLATDSVEEHSLAGVWRHFSCRIVHGRLPARYPVGSGLHDRNLLLCQKARLPQQDFLYL